MMRVKAHIALSFLVVFLFPIVYQSVHLLQHQTTDSHCHHHCCASNQKTDDGKVKIETEEEHQCSICTYQFAANELPFEYLYRVQNPSYAISLNQKAIQDFQSNLILHKSSRAPPYGIAS